MTDKIITIITEDDGKIMKTTKDGRSSDEVIKRLPIKKSTSISNEIKRKLEKYK